MKAANSNKIRVQQRARTGLVKLANRRLQPLGHLSDVCFEQLTTTATGYAKMTSNDKNTLLVDAAVETFNQIGRFDPKRRANSKKGLYSDWPASLDLLPVACGKPVADHVFLCVAMGPAQLLDSHS
jgi:hypothetical protein